MFGNSFVYRGTVFVQEIREQCVLTDGQYAMYVFKKESISLFLTKQASEVWVDLTARSHNLKVRPLLEVRLQIISKP